MPNNREKLAGKNWLPVIFSTPDKSHGKKYKKFDLSGALNRGFLVYLINFQKVYKLEIF